MIGGSQRRSMRTGYSFLTGCNPHEEALQAGVSIAPGPLFSTCDCYDNCIRLNCAVPWSAEVETAMLRLGALASRHLEERGR